MDESGFDGEATITTSVALGGGAAIKCLGSGAVLDPTIASVGAWGKVHAASDAGVDEITSGFAHRVSLVNSCLLFEFLKIIIF